MPVELRLLRKSYGRVAAVEDLNLSLNAGELVVLLGPSGCGKTTALRLVAGLEDVDHGQIIIGDRNVTHVSAAQRDIGMVFQAYSLFPHMTARENVAFGLRMRGVPPGDRGRRANDMLELVGLSAEAERYAHQLSGGQQQRVALARALAVQPSVLLLDEPLSALDATVRTQLRDEIRRLQVELGTTTLFVTHDQEEALAVADRVGVMRGGRLEQIGRPSDLYQYPGSDFVAGFLGLSNRLPGYVQGDSIDVLGEQLPVVNAGNVNGAVSALVRPEAIDIREYNQFEDDHRQLKGTVSSCVFLGASARIVVQLASGHCVTVHAPASDVNEYPVSTVVQLRIQAKPVYVISAHRSIDSRQMSDRGE